ncbi:MAG: Asp-tRNA(Asn)/Glu-tRNA(Gln) amidotransferase subunit GatC [Puniceicoccaceae bacterium]
MQERPEVDIDKLAMLSRIQLTEEEKAAFSGQLSDILGFFQKLQEVDVEGIAPMAHPFDAEAPLREDEAAEPWAPERALSNAPASRENQVIVPKVVEDA